MTFGKYLFTLRTDRSLALRDVAQAVGLSAKELCDIEHDRAFARLDTLKALAAHYDVPQKVMFLQTLLLSERE